MLLLLYLYLALVVICTIAKALFRFAVKVAPIVLPIHLVYCLINDRPILERN